MYKLICVFLFFGTTILFGEIIAHNGFSYKTVTSPITGKIWLDRNLGAKRSCEKNIDKNFKNEKAYIKAEEDCFGDLYQWGRFPDGHERISSSITKVRLKEFKRINSKFIIGHSTCHDWLECSDKQDIDKNGSKRIKYWSKSDGNSICPKGFRVPTANELDIETVQQINKNNYKGNRVNNRSSAFENFLKIPSTYVRSSFNGKVKLDIGILWTNSIEPSSKHPLVMFFNKEIATCFAFSPRNIGAPVRCIKD